MPIHASATELKGALGLTKNPLMQNQLELGTQPPRSSQCAIALGLPLIMGDHSTKAIAAITHNRE